MRVGVFDSGIGGLTVLKTLKQKYPHNDYIYYGDTANLPYGSKTKEELKVLATNNVDFLLKHHVDIIIIACGTVSSNCLSYLKGKYQIPIYDIISPTINYLNNSNYKHIGIIATEATINSHIFKKNTNKEIYEIATPKLVPLIENNDLKDIDNVLKEYLAKYQDKIDALVLGCTHYPILLPHIKALLKNTTIIDMSEAININDEGNGITEIYYSKLNENLINNTKRIIDENITIKDSNK